MTGLFHAHSAGQSAILHTQKDRPAQGNSLFGVTNRMLMWHDLANGNRPRLSVSEWPTSTYCSELGEVSARLTLRIVQTAGRIRDLRTTSNNTLQDKWLHEFNLAAVDAKRLHEDIYDFVDSATDEWRPWTLTHQPRGMALIDHTITSRGLATWAVAEPAGVSTRLQSHSNTSGITPVPPPRIDIYPSSFTANLWGSFYCAWLHLLRAMVDLTILAADHDLPYPEIPAISELYESLNGVLLDICAAVPYLLGDVDQNGSIQHGHCPYTASMWVLWLLHRVCVIPGLDPGLRAWIITIFTRIGAHGLRRGTFLANLHICRDYNPPNSHSIDQFAVGSSLGRWFEQSVEAAQGSFFP